jgi:cation:H+ antiporter
MLVEFLLLAVGLAMIIKGGDWFVAASVRSAEFLRMPRVVIGSTLVSLTTTAPELVVSIMAGSRGESALAVGNAIGSCVCNIGLILGVMATLKHIDVHPRALRTPLLTMFGFGFLLLIMTLNLRLSRWGGGLLVLLGVSYFAFDFIRHKRDTKPADIVEARAIEEEVIGQSRLLRTRVGTAMQFALGAAVVVVGSRFLVDAAVQIAGALGISSIFIGLTVIAVGTSLPELITAITSSRRNVSDLAVGNVLGANIANLSLIVGSAAAIQEVAMDRATQLYNFPALLIMMALLFQVLRSDHRVTRREGLLLLASYGVYITGLVLLTMLQRQ